MQMHDRATKSLTNVPVCVYYVGMSHHQVAALAIDSIEANPDQPRKRFEAGALDELAASIAAHGVLEPILVRPAGERYRIIAGERRWRAAKLAGLRRIPAIVRSGLTDAQAFELSMIENVIRADMDPVEEAAGYQTLIDAGLDVKAISQRLGKNVTAIRCRLDLLRLARPIRKLVADGQLDTQRAWHIARLSHEGQYQVMRAMSEGAVKTPAELGRLVSAIEERERQPTMFEASVVEEGAERHRARRELTETLVDLADKLHRAERALGTASGSPLGEDTFHLAREIERSARAVSAGIQRRYAARLAHDLAVPVAV